MKSNNRFLHTALLLFFITAFSVSIGYGQEVEEEAPREEESIRHSAHLKTMYSPVDYRIAKGFIQTYKNEVSETSGPAIQGLTMHSSLSAAIENAQFQPQYKVGGSFHGVRVYFGKKAGKEVAVVLPIESSGKVATPAGHEKVYVVDLKQRFHDPCPPFCD